MEQIRTLLARHWQPLPAGVRKFILGLGGTIVVLVVVLLNGGGTGGGQASTSDWLSSGYSTSPAAGAGQGGSSGSGQVTGAGGVSAKLMVHVVGLVATPGVYELAPGARVMDAVFAAGGFTAGADQSSVNLARPLNDGEQILVQAVGAASGGYGGQNGGQRGGLVNVNLSDAAGLDQLPGIGPTLAQRIVDYRTANGGFRSLDDLGRVSGIGPALLAKLKPLVSL